jgi:hypothetical protein
MPNIIVKNWKKWGKLLFCREYFRTISGKRCSLLKHEFCKQIFWLDAGELAPLPTPTL